MGLHNKLYRGVLVDEEPDCLDAPLEEPERTLEKLWVAAVDKFAIGGGCQLLLVVDYVIAEKGSYFSLPGAQGRFPARHLEHAVAALCRRTAGARSDPV